MATLEHRLQRIEDESAIRQLNGRFADAVVRGDSATFAQLWTPNDSVWSLPKPLPMTAEGVVDINAMFHKLRDSHDFFVQSVLSDVTEIDSAGGRATARVIIRELGRGPGPTWYSNYAMYEDIMVKREGGWLFLSRVCDYVFLDAFRLPDPGLPKDE